MAVILTRSLCVGDIILGYPSVYNFEKFFPLIQVISKVIDVNMNWLGRKMKNASNNRSLHRFVRALMQ